MIYCKEVVLHGEMSVLLVIHRTCKHVSERKKLLGRGPFVSVLFEQEKNVHLRSAKAHTACH